MVNEASRRHWWTYAGLRANLDEPRLPTGPLGGTSAPRWTAGGLLDPSRVAADVPSPMWPTCGLHAWRSLPRGDLRGPAKGP